MTTTEYKLLLQKMKQKITLFGTAEISPVAQDDLLKLIQAHLDEIEHWDLLKQEGLTVSPSYWLANLILEAYKHGGGK